jgi:hypothetical protein
MMKRARFAIGLVAICSLPACDPFEAVSTNEEIIVPQNKVSSIELLVPGRKLPLSAKNVRVFEKHFQDTILYVRFDANAEEARAFAEQLVGQPLTRNSYANMRGPDVDWWISEDLVPQTERGEDTTVDGDGLPAVAVAMRENGRTATV